MIKPVILAGGTGTRLWPMSRQSYPKQFTAFVGDATLFQSTVQRTKATEFDAPCIVTNADFRFMVADQMDGMGIDANDIVLEPEGRNTAPAILNAALRHEDTPDLVLLVMPSDHQIADEAGFREAVTAGRMAAEAGEIVTFGITPDSAHTGYGYLELSKTAVTGQPQVLRSFTEKPDVETAQTFMDGQRHLWNAGIFMFRVSTIIDTFQILAPHILMSCRAALATGSEDMCFFRLGAEAYGRCADISIDHAIMEAVEALTVIPVDCGWSDLGSWGAIHRAKDKDGDGNALSESATQIGCTNSLLMSDDADLRVVGLGLDNIAAIATGDALLIADMADSEGVKAAVAELRALEAPQADGFRRCHRPWGYYETLALGPRFQVKRIMVKPGGCLSLQSHVHRSEHWVVVEGSATVTVDTAQSLITENESVYIPLGAIHRLENRGKVPLNLIEVQSGAYLGEDDIVRYEDIYARVSPPKAA